MKMKFWFSGFAIVLVLTLLFIMTGCAAIVKGIGEKIGSEVSKQVSNITDKETGASISVENETTSSNETTLADETTANASTTVTDSGIEWPQDKMGDLPRIDAPISGVLNGEFGTIVSFAGVTKDQATQYVAELKKLNYEATLESVDAELIAFFGSKEIDGKTATCMVNYDISEQTAQITFLDK